VHTLRRACEEVEGSLNYEVERATTRGGCTSQVNEGPVQLVEGAHFKKEVGMHS
jgi:hypothetical protein